MIVRTTVSLGEQEVEVPVSIEDIVVALNESPDTKGACLTGLNSCAQFLKAVPDAVIAEMTPAQRDTIRSFLAQQADRYTRVS
jgi:hypothetical protein